MNSVRSWALGFLIASLVGCDQEASSLSRQFDELLPAGHVPAGLEGLEAVAPSQEMIALGAQLFFDRRISAGDQKACRDCHQPEHAFAGVGDEGLKRDIPSLLNVAYAPVFGRDGGHRSLEERIRTCLGAYMTGDTAMSAARLDQLEGYNDQRESLDLDGGEGMILVPLAAFVSALLSGESRWDLYRQGQKDALNELEVRGRDLFFGTARCHECHRGALLTDFAAHNVGVGMHLSEFDPGRFALTQKSGDIGLFVTQGLRDVAETAPYMHDGSLQTLEDVVAFYNRGGTVNPNLDTRLAPLRLSPDDQEALVAFLKTLSGRWPRLSSPQLP